MRHNKQSNMLDTSKSKDISSLEDEPTIIINDTANAVIQSIEDGENVIGSGAVNNDPNNEDNESPVHVDDTANCSIRNGGETDGFVEYNSSCEVIETVIESEDRTSIQSDELCSVNYENDFLNVNETDNSENDFYEAEDGKLFDKNKKPKDKIKKTTFKCEICGKCFTLKAHLNNHVKTHTGEKSFHCKTCKKDFALAHSLKRHKKTHIGEKPHKCTTCNKGFTQPHDLKRHERIHTGEKPYACKYCKKCFVQSGDLTKHERIHIGEKPFQCKSCPKSFAQGFTLKRHMRIHTGEKPYQCTACKKCFAYLNVLKRHKRTHKIEL